MDHVEGAVHEQLDETWTHARFDDLLNFLVRSVAEIGESPAGVGEHVGVLVVEENGESLERWLHFHELNGRVLASAEIGQAPDGVSGHRQSTGLGQNPGQIDKSQSEANGREGREVKRLT